MYKVSETVLPIYINGQCPIIKICSDVTLNLSSKDSKLSNLIVYYYNGKSKFVEIVLTRTDVNMCIEKDKYLITAPSTKGHHKEPNIVDTR